MQHMLRPACLEPSLSSIAFDVPIDGVSGDRQSLLATCDGPQGEAEKAAQGNQRVALRLRNESLPWHDSMSLERKSTAHALRPGVQHRCGQIIVVPWVEQECRILQEPGTGSALLSGAKSARG